MTDFTQKLDDALDAVRDAEIPSDADAQAELLSLSVRIGEESLFLSRRLIGRLRGTATTTCDSPPDLHGLCMECGRKIAPAVADHQPGCDPLAIVVLRLYRLTVRIRRLGRLMWAAAQRSER